MSDQARMAAPALQERTERNPVAVGLLALGVGFLATTLLPPTEHERKLRSVSAKSFSP